MGHDTPTASYSLFTTDVPQPHMTAIHPLCFAGNPDGMTSPSTRNWRRTPLTGAGGSLVADDWTLIDDAGQPLARIYRVMGGPKSGQWAWFVQVAPDGTPWNGGTGHAATGREAREAVEALIPVGTRERRPQPD